MKKRKSHHRLIVLALGMIIPLIAMSQSPVATLMVSGYAGSLPLTQWNGRNYVDVAALAQMVNGSLSYNGGQITLTLPAGAGSGTTPAPPTPAAAGFSTDFLRAGIESMSTVREWHTALGSAITNQYAVTQSLLRPYEAQALANLRLAQAAAQTDADRNAAQMIANEYGKMKRLSDKYVAMRKELSYIAPDSLANDELEQSVLACGKALGAMAAAGQFSDEPACH